LTAQYPVQHSLEKPGRTQGLPTHLPVVVVWALERLTPAMAATPPTAVAMAALTAVRRETDPAIFFVSASNSLSSIPQYFPCWTIAWSLLVSLRPIDP
jgi:hypothetical protein